MDLGLGTIWSFLAGIWFLILAARILSFHRSVKLLKFQREGNPARWPTVSLIIPACNEAATIVPALQTLLRMDYPDLELVVVDDRSTDGSGILVSQINDSRIKLIRIDQLPEQWLGKCHALHQGVKAASGEWLLFSDADVHYKSASLKKAIYFCLHSNLDFLAIGPSFISKTLPLQIMVAQFLHQLSLAFDWRRLADPKKPDAIGTGAFNLVRRSAFERSEGFRGIKMDVIDDGALAWLMKGCGAKLGFLGGLDEIEVEWYPSFSAFVKGLEKNAFALFQYSLKAVLVYLVGCWTILILSLAPLFFSKGIIAAFYLTSLTIYILASGLTIKQKLGGSPLLALTLPFSFFVLPLVFLRSAIICLKQYGINWRGTLYPIEDLRAHQRLRTIDLFFGK